MKGLKIVFLVSVFCGWLPAQWEPDKRLTIYPSYSDYGSYSNAWTIAVWDTMVHIVWEHNLSSVIGELYYIRSTNSGLNFGADKQLTTQDSHLSSIAVWGSSIHVVWHDYRDGNYEIYYKRSVDNGVNWEADVRLTDGPASSRSPSIAVWNSIVHVVWHDSRDGNQEIYYKRSVNNGLDWSSDVRLTDDPASSHYPSVAVWDSMVHVAWMDERNNQEIYYKRSVDNGVNW